MKETVIIKAEKRGNTNSRQNKRLRNDGFLPGSICGKEMESIAVTVKKEELRKILTTHGINSVFKIDIAGDSKEVMIKTIQKSPLNGDYLHVEFLHISLTEEIKADVVFKFIGKEIVEAKRLVVIRHIDSIIVRGLPQAIPDSIEIDITNLQVGDNVKIGDIKLPEGITCELEPEQIIVVVSEPKAVQTDSEETAELEKINDDSKKNA